MITNKENDDDLITVCNRGYSVVTLHPVGLYRGYGVVVDVFGFVGGIVVVDEFGVVEAVVGDVVVGLLRRFGLNLRRRSSRSACIFCAWVWGGAGVSVVGGVSDAFAVLAVVSVIVLRGRVLVGDVVGGVAGSVHRDLVGVCIGVLTSGGVVVSL